MITPQRLLLSAALAAVLASPRPAAAQAEPARKLTLADVVMLAAAQSVGVRVAEQGVVAAEARIDATRARLFPSLSTEANVLVWNKALRIDFGQPIPIRDQVTSNVSVTIAQPLSPLIPLMYLLDIEQAGADAAAADKDGAQLEAAQRSSEAFLRALQARSLAQVAEKSLAQVDAQLERAKALEKAGVLASVDLLRLESARAAALQGVLRARTGVQIADRGLVLSLDLPAGTAVEPVDDLPDPPPKVTLSPEAAQAAARMRPELEAAQKRVEQAQGGRTVAQAELYPIVNLVGTYQHAEGQGEFSDKDSAFAGVILSWTFFEWGRTFDQMAEADARATQVELGAHALAQQIAFEVERASLEVGTTYDMLGVAGSGLRAAEEAHRIQSVRYEQGAATTTDLLDAETELARARISYASARYEYYVAMASLARALGRFPSADPAELGVQ